MFLEVLRNTALIEVIHGIIGMHALMYSKKDEATRRFFRDVEELGIYEPKHPTAISTSPRRPPQ